MYGDVQVLGKGLKGGGACGKDIEHDRLQPGNKGAKALIGECLVVLDQVQAAAHCSFCHCRRPRWVQALLGLDDGADEGPVVDAPNLARVLYPEPGTLMRPDYALRKDDILQAHLLEVSCHHREVLGTFPGRKSSSGNPMSKVLLQRYREFAIHIHQKRQLENR